MNSSPLHPHTQTHTLHSMAPALSQSSWVGVCHSAVHSIKGNRRPGRVFQGLPSTKTQVIHHRPWRSTVFTWRRSKDQAVGHAPPFACQGLTRLAKDPGTPSLTPTLWCYDPNGGWHKDCLCWLPVWRDLKLSLWNPWICKTKGSCQHLCPNCFLPDDTLLETLLDLP